jgi:peptide deformylase
MAILKVARMGHPVLRAKAKPIPPAEIGSVVVQTLIDDMFETMREYAGIGLAAPQVHESVRIFVAGVRNVAIPPVLDDDEEMPFIVLINPEVAPIGRAAEEGWEGCLSIPDIRGLVPRALDVHVKAYDRTGRRVELVAKGLSSRVIQHETDHLDGILFFDRMVSYESLTFMDEYRRYWAKDEDDEDETDEKSEKHAAVQDAAKKAPRAKTGR